MNAQCPSCGKQSQLGTRVGFKVGMMAVPALLGPKALKARPLASLAVLGLAALIGHQLDRYVLPNCPACGVMLKPVG